MPPCSWSGEGLALPLICPRAPIAGVNLLVGTENGLMLLDRSGQGKVYGLIGRRRFQQMDVLEGLNLLITISGVCGGQGREEGSAPGPSVTTFSLGGGQPWSRSWKVGPHFLTPRGSHPKDSGEAEAGPPMRGVCVSVPQGKGTNCGYIICPGSGTRSCTMTQKWRRSRAGPLWGTWRAAGTTVLVRRSRHSGRGTFVYEKRKKQGPWLRKPCSQRWGAHSWGYRQTCGRGCSPRREVAASLFLPARSEI